MPIVPTAAPRVHVPHADGGFPDLGPETHAQAQAGAQAEARAGAPDAHAVAAAPDPDPHAAARVPPPHVPPHHPCDPGPCTITNGGGED